MAIPKVLNKTVLAHKIEKTKVSNGLIIPDSMNEQKEYIIDAIGSNVKEVAVGDTVVLNGYNFKEIVYNEIVYLAFDENQIAAVLPSR